MFLGHMTRVVNSKAQSIKTTRPNRIEILWDKVKQLSSLYGIRMLQNTVKLKHSGVNGATDTRKKKREPAIFLSSPSGLCTTLPNSLPGCPVLFSLKDFAHSKFLFTFSHDECCMRAGPLLCLLLYLQHPVVKGFINKRMCTRTVQSVQAAVREHNRRGG